jgi:hypothetical protein
MDMYITTGRKVSAVKRVEQALKEYRAIISGKPVEEFLNDEEKARISDVKTIENFLVKENILEAANILRRSWRYSIDRLENVIKLMQEYEKKEIVKESFLRRAFGNHCIHDKVKK